MWEYNTPEELYHWGILGMKWGVRRYQNKNGKLTPAGKRKKKYYSKDSREAYRLSKKKLYEMSNDEIKTLNKRKQLESDYKRLNKNHVAIGIAAVATTAALLSNYKTIKQNVGFRGKTTLLEDGKALVKKMGSYVVKTH